MMSKRSVFTNITPLPPHVTRTTAVAWLHDHKEMIELNPLVLRFRPCEPHDSAPQEELACRWYEITDQINYLPGGWMKSEVKYKGAFHDLPHGLQTHVYAPAGLDLRGKWTVCGNMPGEPKAPVELGSGIPRDGLYIREDVDIRCNILLVGFVKKNLNKSHKAVIDSIVKKANLGPSKRADGAERAAAVDLQQRVAPSPEPQELPASIQDDLHRELPACQCSHGHEPTCSMYVDPTLGRFSDLQVNEQKRTSHGPVPYEEFNYVRFTSAESNNPELFSGNFHPLSHYNLLLGSRKPTEDEVPAVQAARVSLVSVELPATPSKVINS